MTHTQRPRPIKRILVAVAGLALVAGVGTTAAAYIDTVNVNLGSGTTPGGIGNPNEFEVQVQDSSGQWKDADDYPSSVILPVTPDKVLSKVTPTVYSVTARIEPGSPQGDVVPSLYAAPDCTLRCAALFGKMRFTVSYDGGAPIATSVTATDYNAIADRGFDDVQPGEEHTILVSVILTEDTPFLWTNSESMFGMKFEGVTTQ